MPFVPAFQELGSPGSPRTAWVIHGILGSGRNWRSLTRRLSEQHPGWRFVLADLRHHGDSRGASPPDTLAACAADLARLLEHGSRPDVVIGHSFGGKVALELRRTGAVGEPVTWALDSPPGRVAGEPTDVTHDALGVLQALREVPGPVADRGELREGLRARGLPDPIVGWLLTSARRGDDRRWRWVYDLDAIDTLLSDYFQADYWPWLRSTDAEVHLVQAGRGGRWTPADLGALRTLPTGSRVTHHLLERAGHWVHVDDPEGTMALLARSLPAP